MYILLLIMATIGKIAPYNENEEEFDSYCSRCDLYFIANDIADAKLVPAFLTLVGPKVYNLAKNLVSPKEVSNCTYEEIKDALKSHYKPKVILIYERFKFYSRSQKSGESIADFVAALKAFAHTCSFNTTLNDMLRDRFVMGLSDEKPSILCLQKQTLHLLEQLKLQPHVKLHVETFRLWVNCLFIKCNSPLKVLILNLTILIIVVFSLSLSIFKMLNLKVLLSLALVHHALGVVICTGRLIVHLKMPHVIIVRVKDTFRKCVFMLINLNLNLNLQKGERM